MLSYESLIKATVNKEAVKILFKEAKKSNDNYHWIRFWKRVLEEIRWETPCPTEFFPELNDAAYKIRSTNYKAGLALFAVLNTATYWENLRWGWQFAMPLTSDCMCNIAHAKKKFKAGYNAIPDGIFWQKGSF